MSRQRRGLRGRAGTSNPTAELRDGLLILFGVDTQGSEGYYWFVQYSLLY